MEDETKSPWRGEGSIRKVAEGKHEGKWRLQWVTLVHPAKDDGTPDVSRRVPQRVDRLFAEKGDAIKWRDEEKAPPLGASDPIRRPLPEEGSGAYAPLMSPSVVFSFAVSPLEIVLRGSVMYLALFGLLRLVLKRQTSTFSTADLLLVVLIADASQNGMAGGYKSIPEGLVLVTTLVFWNYALDWLGYHVPWFERLTYPAPLRLVREGRMERRNMRRELITVAELMAHLREQGVERVEDVKAAFMEGDGEISVIPYGETRAG